MTARGFGPRWRWSDRWMVARACKGRRLTLNTQSKQRVESEQEGGSDRPALRRRLRQDRRTHRQTENPRVRVEQIGDDDQIGAVDPHLRRRPHRRFGLLEIPHHDLPARMEHLLHQAEIPDAVLEVVPCVATCHDLPIIRTAHEKSCFGSRLNPSRMMRVRRPPPMKPMDLALIGDFELHGSGQCAV